MASLSSPCRSEGEPDDEPIERLTMRIPDDIIDAVNADPREGRLKRILPEELTDFYPGLTFRTDTGKSEGGEGSSLRGGEFWRNVFWGVLLLMVAESLLALYFARGRVLRS